MEGTAVSHQLTANSKKRSPSSVIGRRSSCRVLSMTLFADGPVVEVSVSIDAPVEAVWDLVTDINLPARFQGEFVEAEWLDDGPALGARFVGRSERGDWKWETTSWVVAYEPLQAFGWAVSDKDNPGATWTFFLESQDDATTLRFHRILGPGPSGVASAIERHPDREEQIIADRDAEQRQNMQAVLDGVKELAETEGSQSTVLS